MKYCFRLFSTVTGEEVRCELVPNCQCRTLTCAGHEIRLCYGSSAERLNVSATLLSGGEFEGVVAAVELVIPEWRVENYLLLPAAVYDGNRTEIRAESYPPQNAPGVVEVNPPTHTSHLPHFNPGGGGVIEQTTGDLSFPGIGFFDSAAGTSRWILTPCRNRYGNYGYRLEERPEKQEFFIAITSPVYRRFRQTYCRPVPAEDVPILWKEGETIEFELQFSERSGQGIPDLFHHMMELRNRIEPHGTMPPVLPLSRADRLIKEKYLQSNWDEESGYFLMAPDIASELICFHWQLGWVGGGLATLPMLFDEDGELRRRARRNLETVFLKGQAASGLYYGAARHGVYYADTLLEPTADGRHLIRKNADALSFFLRQFRLLEAHGEEVPAVWRDSLLRQAEALAGIWEKNHQFGQWVEMETGRILIGGSACGVMAIGGLALASEYFHSGRFLAAARESAEYYAREYLERGILNGAPGEIMQACDSEASYAMLDSMMTLWEITGEEQYLHRAEMAADYCASWCVSYDYAFPPESLFGRLGMTSCGTVWANTQNKHSAPGFCTGSGLALLKLFRATGKRCYLELIRDVVHALPQYVSRPDRPIGEQESGWINERVNLSDWEGPEMVGGIFHGSCWPEVTLMLSYLELPGIYVLSDRREIWNFDNLDARWDGDDLVIVNPTAFPARVKVLFETDRECRGRKWEMESSNRYYEIELPACAEHRLSGTSR